MGCKTFPHASQTRFNDTQFLFMDRHCHKVDAMYGPCLEREFALSRVGSCRAKRSMGYGLQNLCLDFARVLLKGHDLTYVELKDTCQIQLKNIHEKPRKVWSKGFFYIYSNYKKTFY